MMRRALLLPVLLLAAGCANGAGSWSKPGAAAADTDREYAECRALARAGVRTDANIDQDIAASRSSDAQRTEIVRSQTRQMQETTHARSDAIIASCMAAKGFGATRRP